jgi:hypothetical protein
VTDRLHIVAEATTAQGDETVARVTLVDGRVLKLPVTVRPPRVRVELLDKSVIATGPARHYVFAFPDKTLLPDTARLIFSVRASNMPVLTSDVIEISGPSVKTLRLAAGPNPQLQDGGVLIAMLDPAKLGPTAFGPLRFQVVRGSDASDWQPLTTLVRLPTIDGIDWCRARSMCSVRTSAIPDRVAFRHCGLRQAGTGTAAIYRPSPPPNAGKLYVRLRDASTQQLVLQAAA